MLPAALLLAGCIDNTLAPAKDDAPPDTAGGSDTAPPGDITVEAGCTPPAADWAIRQRWAWAPPDDGHGLWFPHIGRFEDADSDGVVSLADPMGIWMTGVGGDAAMDYLVDATGRTAWELPVAEDAFSIATIGDVEPSRFGMEYLTSLSTPDHESYLSAYGEQTLLWRSDIANARDGSLLSLADLEADGTPDLLAVSYAASATDGSLEFTFAGEGTRNASGDLDLDGYPEILTISASQPRVYDHRGALLATCPVSMNPNSALFAMGNLDEDDAGEFAVASAEGVAVCDTDGSLLASAPLPSSVNTTLALAELDGDPLPEVLLDVHPQDGTPPLVVALDTDLTPLWTHTLPADQGQLPFSVADLDGDGRHEVLLPTTHVLEILGPDGRLLSSVTGPDRPIYGQPPMVVDLDGDGLAEIVLSGGGEEFLAAYDNPEGGWRVLGASDPWPDSQHFPGDRNFDGTLPDPGDVHWLRPGHNVWLGTPALPASFPDLAISFEAVRADDCSDVQADLLLANVGPAPTTVPATVELFDGRTGAPLGSASVPAPLHSGEQVRVTLPVPAGPRPGGLRATVRTADDQCAETPDEATTNTLPCG